MKLASIFILSMSILLGGCVVGTRNIELNMPEYSNDKTAVGDIYISSIRDSRHFEQKPRKPSTPSVDGTLSNTPKEKLATLIGRQRNGYGKAMGDVALPPGMTIEKKMRELMTVGLQSRGYNVVNDKTAKIKLSVDISKFWGWSTPGFWALSFESDVQARIVLGEDSQQQEIEVKGYGINKGQVGSDDNWKLAYQRAFEDFLKKLDMLLDEKSQ